MATLLNQVETRHSPQSLAAGVRHRGGLVLLESSMIGSGHGRYSLVAVDPVLAFRAEGARCEVTGSDLSQVYYGNPWKVLGDWMMRFELSEEQGLGFPAGGCFGYWGYELRRFVEPKLGPHRGTDLPFPDAWLGFYDSLVVFDHQQSGVWVISTGLEADGRRSAARAQGRAEFWADALATAPGTDNLISDTCGRRSGGDLLGAGSRSVSANTAVAGARWSGMTPAGYEARVRRAQHFIRQGHIYQVNLAQRWRVEAVVDAWELYRQLTIRSPSPFAGLVETDAFAVVSASPELFLRMDGERVLTRPIKGTRRRGLDIETDTALAAELLGSAKERAELTMITDLLRNDLGRVCDFGTVEVPELMRLERFAQVQHLVATVTGRLRRDVSHLEALEACFPGGSVTGAPKFRAMQIIDELEPVGRGPYTGCLGYLGFNRRSQLSIIIRAAFCSSKEVYFHGGAGIVADSEAAAEQAEVLAKVGALREVLDTEGPGQAHFTPVTLGWGC